MESNPDEVAQFIEALRASSGIKVNEQYTHLDRYRDFQTAFGSEAGRKVLSQIVDKSDRRTNESDAADAHKLIWRAAQRELAQWICAIATVVPRQE